MGCAGLARNLKFRCCCVGLTHFVCHRVLCGCVAVCLCGRVLVWPCGRCCTCPATALALPLHRPCSIGITAPKRIIATGGASSNPTITQVIADVFGAPVYTSTQTDSASLGAALRALHGAACQRAESHGRHAGAGTGAGTAGGDGDGDESKEAGAGAGGGAGGGGIDGGGSGGAGGGGSGSGGGGALPFTFDELVGGGLEASLKRVATPDGAAHDEYTRRLPAFVAAEDKLVATFQPRSTL